MRLKQIVTFVMALACNLLSQTARAQQFSYVYIQGDKQTPFYVKLEGEMQPRYGKNYSIISQLAPGIINIEILFQQNIYPPQRFAIKVPENGSRAFLLSKKGSSFSLFDLQQQFYIAAGNSGEDDHIPTYNPGDNYIATNSKTATYQTSATSSSNYSTTYNSQAAANTQNATPQYSNTSNKARTNNKEAQNKEPQFIDNVELDNERTVRTNAEPEVVNNIEPETTTEAAIAKNTNTKGSFAVNSDCPQAIQDNAFQDIYSKMSSKSDKTRLKFLLGKLNYCYTSSQIRILTKGLNNDPERYAYLKQAYGRVTDQGNFASLENLLTTREWKDYFKLIMP